MGKPSTEPQPSLTVVLYGIPNCDTVKRARAWFAEPVAADLANPRAVVCFHDFKKQGVPADALTHWLGALGWERLLNRQGSTWRKLSPDRQAAVRDEASAAALMLEQPSVIRRPVVQWAPGEFTVGFDEAAWRSQLARAR